jgi:hypothetical protein
MRREGHVARVEEMKNARKILIGNLKGNGSFGRINAGGRMILKWILKT